TRSCSISVLTLDVGPAHRDPCVRPASQAREDFRDMSKVTRFLGIAAASAMAITFTAGGIDAAGSVKTTKDDCMTAWATLMASHPAVHVAFPHQEYKEAILNVIKWHPHWTVGAYEAGVSQRFDLSTFDTRFHEGGTAYVAH